MGAKVVFFQGGASGKFASFISIGQLARSPGACLYNCRSPPTTHPFTQAIPLRKAQVGYGATSRVLGRTCRSRYLPDCEVVSTCRVLQKNVYQN